MDIECKACHFLLSIEDDEYFTIESITQESHNAKVRNGDVVCDTCKNESLCGRCGEFSDDAYNCFHCEFCMRGILIECVALCWCQCHDVICKDCILKEASNKWLCEKCGVDLRESLSEDLSICVDAQKLLCVECM